MFEQEVQRVLDYVVRGNSVRIVGAPGSGRSAVLQRVAASLEKTGASVYNITGLRTHRRIPFAGINAVGLDLRLGTLGVLGVADVLTAQMSKPGRHVIVVDDLEFVDNESMAVLEAVLLRTKRPVVMTMGDSRLYANVPPTVVIRGPEAQVQLNPLRYEHVNDLIVQALGGPVDADVTARVMTKSAGNPRLVVRIVETAALSNLLERQDGRWTMTGDTLWNDHLRGTVEALLEGLHVDEITALQTIALIGSASLRVLQDVIESEVLDSLERRGFISLMEDQQRRMMAAINPPLAADYFRSRSNSSDRHVLRSKIARVLNAVPQPSQGDESTADAVGRVLRELQAESSTDNAATARHFNEQTQADERSLYEHWENEKTMANAAQLLVSYWAAPADPRRIETVFRETCTEHGAPSDLLFFEVTRALWEVHSGRDVSAVAESLDGLRRRHPRLEAEAEAAALFIRASYDSMPANVDAVLARLEDRQGAHGIVATVRGLVELYKFNPTGALASATSIADDDLAPFPGIRPFIQEMALFAAGRVEESLIYSLERRAEARRNLDQFGLVTSSYVAAQGLMYCGRFDEAEYLMSGIFGMGRPGLLANSLYDAMLRLAGLRSATTAVTPSATLASHARRGALDIGPLPGTGKAVYELVAKRPVEAETFDREAAALIQRQMSLGYVLEAAMCSLFCTCLLPGTRVLDLARRILKESGVTIHDQLLDIARAVVEGDLRLLGVLLKHYTPDADLYPVGMLLRGAFKRYVLIGDSLSAAEVDRAFDAFATRYPAVSQILPFNTTDSLPLTVREIEVAALAGHLSNPEIAEHLGISLRTVENHISNALRKTGTATRNSLFELVRNTYPSP
ncbi:LuxR C-terminal-related transcriptional regulator [bacterium RCC_150]